LFHELKIAHTAEDTNDSLVHRLYVTERTKELISSLIS